MKTEDKRYTDSWNSLSTGSPMDQTAAHLIWDLFKHKLALNKTKTKTVKCGLTLF